MRSLSPEDQFFQVFGSRPTLRVDAPGRVNLIGEHVDYLGGQVVPAAIDLRVTMLARRSEAVGREARIWTELTGDAVTRLPLTDLERRKDPKESWMNYILGVLAGYAAREVNLPGCEVAIFSSLPTGAGLSSSAALEMATALLVESFADVALSVVERALICQEAEHRYAGVPCGIMDQFAVGAGRQGHVLLMDCQALKVEPIPLPAGVAMVISDTGVKHALADGEYGKRRSECEAALARLNKASWRDVSSAEVEHKRGELGDRLSRRSRHVVSEMTRVDEFVDELRAGRSEGLAELMRSGHESLRADFEVSCPELDALVDAAYQFGPDHGLIGSRMTGGGFGGSTISLVRESIASALIDHLCSRFEEAFGRRPRCFTARASEGARAEFLTEDVSINP
ncbi:MAG: galactokinase [Verrucomicrobiota bacterium]